MRATFQITTILPRAHRFCPVANQQPHCKLHIISTVITNPTDQAAGNAVRIFGNTPGNSILLEKLTTVDIPLPDNGSGRSR